MSDGHPEWLRGHADSLETFGYDHHDDGPARGAIPEQMRMAADEIERLRDAVENWYGDGSYSANGGEGHTDWCLDHVFDGGEWPLADDDDEDDPVFVGDHDRCICGWRAARTEREATS